MKIFHRVLAVVLALILTVAVLPLGVFASEKPWFEVEAETQSPNGTDTDTKIVVKLDAKQLLKLVQDTGISSELLNKLKECISIDTNDLMSIINMDQLFKLIPLEMIPFTDIIAALGEDVDLYFDLEKLLGGLTAAQLESLVNTQNALPVLLDHYGNTDDGLVGLLTTLLSAGGATDENGDGIPDNCPVKVEELIAADFWTAECFNGGVNNVSIDKYLTAGYITIADIMSYWPQANGTYDISFLTLLGANADVKVDLFLADLEKKGISLVPYLNSEEMIAENPAITALIESNPHKYLTNAGYAQIEALAKAAVAAKNDWSESDFNITALKAYYGLTEDWEFALKYNENPAEVEALVKSNPKAYLAAATYDAFIASAFTPNNLKTFGVSMFYIDVLRADIEAADPNFKYEDYVDTAKFVADNAATLANNYKTYLTQTGLSKIYAKVDMIAIARKIGIGNLIKEEGFSNVIGWLNFDKVLEGIAASDKSIADYVYVDRVIKAIGFDNVWDILMASGKPLDTIVDMPRAISAIGMPALFAELSIEEMATLYKKFPVVKDALKNIVTTIAAKLPYIIDELTFNGTVFAKEDPNSLSGKLSIDPVTLIKSLIKAIPSLTDLANLKDDTLFSAAFGMTYKLDGEDPVTKNVSVDFVLVGARDDIRALATTLQKLIQTLNKFVNFSINDLLQVQLHINVPEQATKLYAKVLASEKLPDELRQKLLILPTLDGNGAVAMIQSMTMAEIVEILDKVTPGSLYEKILQIKYVEAALDKIAAVTGKDLSALKLEDVLGLMDDAIDKAGSVGIVQKIYAAVKAKTGIDVSTVLEVEDLDAIYQTAIEKAKVSESTFNKVKNYIQLIADKINNVLPQAMNTSIGDFYTENGKFAVSASKKFEIHAKALVKKLLPKIMAKLPASISGKLPADVVDVIADLVPENLKLNPSLDMSVTFANLYRVTYHDITGEVLLDAFLPAGTDLSIYTGYTAPDGVDVDGWRFFDGATATTVTGDMHVYPNVVAGTFKVTVLDDAGNVIAIFDKAAGETLTAEEIEFITYTKSAEAGYENIYRYDLVWYLAGDESTAIDLNRFMVGGSVTICARFERVYLFEGAEDLTVTDDGYKYDNVEFGDGKTQIIIPEVVLNHTKTDDIGIVIAGKDVNGDDIKITIDNATLDQLASLGDVVAITYEKNDTFAVSYYNEKNSDQYTFDFLCGDDPANLTSYSELIGANKEFAGEVTFELPFASIAQTATQGTHVYYTNDADHSRTLINSTVTGTHVIFVAPHFSDFVIANEYALDYSFTHKNSADTTALSGTLGLNDNRHFFPENATLTFDPVINGGDYITSTITWLDLTNASHSAVKDPATGKWTMTMPAYAVSLNIEAEYDVYVTVILKYAKNDSQIATREIRLLSGTSLTAALTPADRDWIADISKDYPVANDQYLYVFTYYWYEQGDATETEVELSDYTAVTENITIVAKFEKDFYFEAKDSTLPAGAVIDAKFDGNTYITEITYNGELGDIKVVLPAIAADIAEKLTDAKWIIRVTNSADNTSFDLLTVNNAMFKKLYEDDNAYVAFDYEKLTSYNLADLYNNANSAAYDMSLVAGKDAGSAASATLIKDSVTVQLPFANGIGNSTSSQVRVNFINASDKRELVAGAAFNAGFVTFKPEHFSYYVVANEYLVTYKFIYNGQAVAGGTVEGLAATGVYYPTGTVVTVSPAAKDYYVGVVYYVKDGNKVTLNKAADANEWSFAITKANAASTELVIELRTTTYHIYFYQLQADNTYALVHTTVYGKGDNLAEIVKGYEDMIAQINLTNAKGYGTYVWTGYDASMLGKADLYVYQTLKLNDYTVNFKDADGNVVAYVTINYNTNKADITLPAAPAKVGYVAAWTGWDTFNVQTAIDQMIAESKTAVDFTVAYTKGSYVIKHDGNVIVDPYAAYGDTVLVEIIQKDHYTATITVLAETGEKIDVTNEIFTMPACGVTVSVTYVANELSYTINGAEQNKVAIGDTVTFVINVKKGERIASISDFCKLAAMEVKANGTLVLTYTFTVTDDNMAVEYTLEAVKYDLIHIFNGTAFNGTGDPVVNEKGVTFAGWSDTVAGTFAFATFTVERTTSLLWLWILLAVILFIAIIAIVYVLYIKEILKPNFITRFAAWIVGGFFAACMFIATIGLRIVGKGGKTAEDLYVTSDEDFEKTMQKIEGEEAAEEAAEEATEENTEAPAEEAEQVEETAAEATEAEATEEDTKA